MSTLTIESTRFGALEIAQDAVIEFPTGLVGLGGRRYTLLAPDAESPFRWLHSVDDPGLALPVTNPWSFFADFAIELSDADAARVGADAAEVWVVVRAGAELSDFSANLHAPIVVANGRGHQVINEIAHPVRAALFPDVAVQAA
ncbi:flagellar assembly protein FliW [Candidatus Solirubrobacter pratensis]|jgi:flagellar assembly factor FliW|uniref:flagellar assembly protein FliW n=1 Tax=Candidatus Solirubrobacter pratensis TaxID=1298857 RepID=UPI0003FBBFD9|nr:flagellar assembly protein FliW [Candidatus Solirubrobacter pratensis]